MPHGCVRQTKVRSARTSGQCHDNIFLHCSGFETDKLPVHSSLVPVLSQLLQFTPDDLRRLDVRKSKTWLPPWQP